MKLFGQLVRTGVNLACLPVDLLKDVATAPLDAMRATDRRVGERTAERLERLKDEARED